MTTETTDREQALLTALRECVKAMQAAAAKAREVLGD